MEPETSRSPVELMLVVAVPPTRRVFEVKRPPKRLEEVALVEVEKVAKVVEAIRPSGEPLSQRPVEVEFTTTPP